MVCTKGMANAGNVNVASTTNIRMDSWEDWIAIFETVRKAVEILVRCLKVAYSNFETLEDFTVEETDSSSNELDGRM